MLCRPFTYLRLAIRSCSSIVYLTFDELDDHVYTWLKEALKDRSPEN